MPAAALAPFRERLSKVDTAWLRMDNDVNRMMIVGVWLLRPRVAYAALCRRVEATLLPYGRFRSAVVRGAGGAEWVEDETFEIGRHVVREALPRHEGMSERARLQARVAELAATPLDPARPLWQFHLVERYDGGSALVARVHHCIADGIALIAVMMAITDGAADASARAKEDAAGQRRRDGQARRAGPRDPLGALTSKAASVATAGALRALDALLDPARGIARGVESAQAATRVVRDLAALGLMADDSPTLLKGALSGRKRVAWGEPLPLDAVKAVGKAYGASVNDVLLAAVAGAIGAWLREAGDDPEGKHIRAMVPVNLRPLEEAWQLGNRFGLAPLVLPIGIANPAARVLDVRARMAELKASTQPLLAYAVLAASGHLAEPAQDALLGLFSKKATAVMTNVPGPDLPLRFCGSTLEQTMFWVPASGDIGVGVSILSYAGGVQFGLVTDEALCAEPQAIVDAFEAEFATLEWLAVMMPWGE